MVLSLYDVGQACRDFRQRKTDKRQKDIADELGYTTMSISNFESGKNNNAMILLWYLNQGLTYEDIIRHRLS